MARLAETRKLPNMFAFEHAWNVIIDWSGSRNFSFPKGSTLRALACCPLLNYLVGTP